MAWISVWLAAVNLRALAALPVAVEKPPLTVVALPELAEVVGVGVDVAATLVGVGVAVAATLVGVAVTTLVGVAATLVGVAATLVGVAVTTLVGVAVAAPVWVLVLYEHFLVTPGYGSEPKASVVQAMVLEVTYL